MFCPNCGTAVEDAVQFCPSCGTAMAEAQTAQQPQAPQQPYYAPQQPYAPVAQAPAQPMKWFKFLIYFALFASAVLNALSGISMLTGSVYGDSAELVYAFFDGLKGLDSFVGIAMLALAGFGIFTRFRLSGFCKNGPMMLNIAYLAGAAVNLIYIIGAFSILPDYVAAEIDITSTVSSIVTSVVMVFVNSAYFKKRKHLFVK